MSLSFLTEGVRDAAGEGLAVSVGGGRATVEVKMISVLG